MKITPSYYAPHEGAHYEEWKWGEVDLTSKARQYHIGPFGPTVLINGQYVAALVWYEIEALEVKYHRWDCLNGQTD